MAALGTAHLAAASAWARLRHSVQRGRSREESMQILQRSIQCVLVAFILLLGVTAWADAPTVIRMAVPGVGVGNRPVTGGSSASTMHLRGMLEKEFEKEGIRVTWSF